MNKEINLQNLTEEHYDYEDIASVENDFDYEDIVSVEDDSEDIVSVEDNCEDIISVENDDEFIISVEDDFEDIVSVEDDDDFIISVEEDYEDEDIVSVEDDDEFIISVEDDYEDITSVENDDEFIISVEDDYEDITSVEDNCEDIISVENDDEFIISVEDDFEDIVGVENNCEDIVSVEDDDEFIINEDDFEDIDGVEDPQGYCMGGYYRVKIGETLCSRYVVKRKLGWGQHSTVWLCWDQRNMQFIALKIMKSAPKITAAAMVEIELLQHIILCDPDGVHKDKIVKLLDYFKVNGMYGTHVCIVFEVLGQDIYKYTIRSGDEGLPLVKVKRIIKQVLEALDYLHTTCQIIHTDIKPDNICLVDNAPEELMAVTLVDLGNGCWVNRHFSGTIQSSAYRCPEVLLGKDYGPNADIWSTACTAFDLATGNFLFLPHAEESSAYDSLHLKAILELLGGKPKRRIIKLLTQTYEWDEEKAYEFSEFLLPMLAIDPNKRSSAKDSLKHQWLQF